MPFATSNQIDVINAEVEKYINEQMRNTTDEDREFTGIQMDKLRRFCNLLNTDVPLEEGWFVFRNLAGSFIFSENTTPLLNLYLNKVDPTDTESGCSLSLKFRALQYIARNAL